jgi:hypothetical protein
MVLNLQVMDESKTHFENIQMEQNTLKNTMDSLLFIINKQQSQLSEANSIINSKQSTIEGLRKDLHIIDEDN